MHLNVWTCSCILMALTLYRTHVKNDTLATFRLKSVQAGKSGRHKTSLTQMLQPPNRKTTFTQIHNYTIIQEVAEKRRKSFPFWTTFLKNFILKLSEKYFSISKNVRSFAPLKNHPHQWKIEKFILLKTPTVHRWLISTVTNSPQEYGSTSMH